MATHVAKTVQRAQQYKKILDIQDTSYISYTSHIKTDGLGIISSRPGTNLSKIQADGVVMHTSFAITTEGLPLGLLDQKIFARPQIDNEIKKIKKRTHNNSVTIEDKESIRWIESLIRSDDAMKSTNTQVITICDREADMYDFFEAANSAQSSVLVRACKDRLINKTSRYSRKNRETLWGFIKILTSQGKIQVEIPARQDKEGRLATLDLHFGSLIMNPSQNNIRHRTEKLPDLNLQMVYVVEKNPPKNETPLEWVLLTNLPVTNFEEAIEKVRWYCLRWRIEVFHKILKSGLRVEDCRLGTAERLIRYLTVMSVIAWRLFMITLVARTNPECPCTIVVWRGWKRLNNLADGWSLFHAK